MHTEISNPPNANKWVGGNISSKSVAAVFIISLVTAILLQVNPLLLNALVQQGRITVQQIGQVATIELGATAIAATLTIAKLPYRRLPTIISAAAITALICNYATFKVESTPVLYVARAVHGCCSGVFMWLLLGLLTRSTRPARLNGIYLATQGVISFAAVTLFSTVIIPRFGAAGGYIGLAAPCLVAAAFALLLPYEFAALPTHDGNRSKLHLPLGGWLGLGAILSFMAAVASAWVYLPSLAERFGYSHGTISTAMSVALATEIAGGLAAAILPPAAPFATIVKVGYLLFAATVALVAYVSSPIFFIVCAGSFGFLWMFLLSPQYPFSLATDPSRRTMSFVGPTQLFGTGLGPLIGSFGLLIGDVHFVMLLASALFLAAFVLTALALQVVPLSRPYGGIIADGPRR